MTGARTGAGLRYLLWAALGLPCIAIGAAYLTGRLFYGEAVHLSGEWSARLLIATLAATPLALMFPGRPSTRWLLRNRRYFGVASFAYAALHTLIYVDKTRSLPTLLDDAVAPEYLTGWIATLVFAVLAATSNDASVRFLRRAWKSLHRWVYLAAVLSFVHWLLVAFDPLPAAVHLVLLAGLESYRVWKVAAIRRRAA